MLTVSGGRRLGVAVGVSVGSTVGVSLGVGVGVSVGSSNDETTIVTEVPSGCSLPPSGFWLITVPLGSSVSFDVVTNALKPASLERLDGLVLGHAHHVRHLLGAVGEVDGDLGALRHLLAGCRVGLDDLVLGLVGLLLVEGGHQVGGLQRRAGRRAVLADDGGAPTSSASRSRR